MNQSNRNEMSAEVDLTAAFALLLDGSPRQAKAHFENILNRRTATWMDRFVALKGKTASMDALGQYHEAETVWANGFAQLVPNSRQPQTLQLQTTQPQRRPKSSSGSGLLWAIGGILALAILTD